jgi:ribose transport system permease protein
MNVATDDKRVLKQHDASKPRRRPSLLRLVSNYGLVLILIALILLFSLLLPDTFPTSTNAQALLNDKANIALLALAVMVPLAAAQYDLSVGFMIGLTHVLAIGLQTKQGLPWGAAAAITVLVGVAVGTCNGLLVAYARIDSFIATLGSGTVVVGISYWYTGGEQVYGDLPYTFTQISQAKLLGVPATALIVLAVAAALWVMFEYLPIGRYLYALGANARTAELVGISPRRFVLGAFMASGTLVAVDGVLLASKLQVGASNVGPDLLLPAFVGALLGATSIRPGRVNAIGTLLAISVLAVGISGLQQEGATYYIEPLFTGLLLIVGVGVMQYGERRRARNAERAAAARARGAAAPSVE